MNLILQSHRQAKRKRARKNAFLTTAVATPWVIGGATILSALVIWKLFGLVETAGQSPMMRFFSENIFSIALIIIATAFLILSGRKGRS